ncbi:MAG: bifunctional oligoribonuclease/PAP phosphatase NrnA, partial [Gemmatimonadota bacterium]|nr:bifunctional oligoribonuclease/PAP phosphatase NrnA [Gemmatimonadota bacterium]
PIRPSAYPPIHPTRYLPPMPTPNSTQKPSWIREAGEIDELLKPGARIVLTTHVNADGDGTGSEVAMWHMLKARGAQPVIANPTPFPERYKWLLEGADGADKTPKAIKEIQRADLILVLDISDIGRLGHLAEAVEARGVPVACIDHHVSEGRLPPGPKVIDATACATGELIFEFAAIMGFNITPEVARALYVAILTDTGGFRFSNTSHRALRVASELIEAGAQPAAIYRDVFASEPVGKVRLLAEVLQTLVHEPEVGLAWITVPPGALERHSLDAEHLEGVVELPRSIAGVRLALLFREIANGRVKVSFRSKGGVDVAEMAARFGGGGHRNAAGASLQLSMAHAQTEVLAVARTILANAG